MMSGVRGSCDGGLKSWLSDAPQKIWPIPAILLVTGDFDSSSVTAAAVWLESVSQSREMSSSVAPIWLTSESGRKEAKIADGGIPLVLLWPGMGEKRWGSMGDWPCLAVITISVESSSPFFFRCE